MTPSVALVYKGRVLGGLFLAAFLVLWKTLLRTLVMGSTLRNIPGPPSPSFLIGNTKQLAARDGWNFLEHLSHDYGSVVKTHGSFRQERLYVFDPKALHHIVVKDHERYGTVMRPFIRLIFGDGLLTAQGVHHKMQRKMLSPAFSAVAMRDMYPIFRRVANQLHSAITVRVQAGAEEIDILHWMSRTALELIGQGGLGHSFDPLLEDTYTGSYAQSLKNLGPALTDFVVFQDFFNSVVMRLGTPQLRRRVMDLLPWKKLHRVRDIVDIVEHTSVDIIEDKKRIMASDPAVRLEQVGEGKDIMSILLRSNMGAAEDKRLGDNEVVGQVALLTLAASDTTSTAMSRVLHLLSMNPKIQDRLRHELKDARASFDGELIDYDTLVSLPFLDAICRETLRLYPPVSMIRRITTEDTILPLTKPLIGIDGAPMQELHVPRGTHIFVGIFASNRDSSVWGPDVLEWNPDRWLNPLPQTVKDLPGIYSHLMTFSGGARSCIGFKFSQSEMKVVLSLLIESFHFSLPKKEISWNLSGIAYPSVDGVDGLPCMPLKVAPVS